MRDTVITIKDLYKSFGNKHILQGVNLELMKNENLVILGKSGTGKSVLIKIICGLIEADSGEVKVLDYDLNNITKKDLQSLRTKVGFCFQNSALYDSMTVEENLAFPLKFALGITDENEINKRIERVLDAVGLEQTRFQMPAELSGGQKKRIGIARTIIVNPEIVLYDEPTAGLDPITCVEINELILKVRDEFGASSIIITHDLTCAKQTGDRVAVLLDGKFRHNGDFEDIFNELATDEVRQFRDYNFIEDINTTNYEKQY